MNRVAEVKAKVIRCFTSGTAFKVLGNFKQEREFIHEVHEETPRDFLGFFAIIRVLRG